MGKLIIIEGTDGSGKQTQTDLAYEKLKESLGEERVRKISFPNYESPASKPVKMYLSGEFGKTAESVNAYAASVLFSVDRYASFKKEWEDFYNSGGVIISDRYTISNMIHQASKIDDKEELEKYLEWLIDLEWLKMAIPKPDIVIFLNMPAEFSQKLMKYRTNKITGDIKKDIHEKDEKYLKKAHNTAKELAKKYNWTVIDCIKDSEIKQIEEINDEIMQKIKKIL